MKTVRSNVFETNSSSCHSITVCSGKDWNDFVNHKVCWVRENWEIEEHLDTTHTLDDCDKIDVNDLFTKVLEVLNDPKKTKFLATYNYRNVDTDSGMSLDLAVFEWLKKEIKTVDKFIEYCTSTNYDLRVKLEKPLDIKFSWNIEPSHYEDFGLYTIHDILKKVIEAAYDCNFPYFYGDDCWDTKHAGMVVTGETPKEIQVEVEDGAHIETDNFFISRDGNMISIKYKVADKVIIERDEEC